MGNCIIDFFYALIGLLLQSCVKINSINERTTKDVNILFILKTYFRSDWVKIMMSFLCIFIEISILDFLEGLEKPINIFGYPSTLFVEGKYVMLPFVTFFSSTLVFAGKSKAEKIINSKS